MAGPDTISAQPSDAPNNPRPERSLLIPRHPIDSTIGRAFGVASILWAIFVLLAAGYLLPLSMRGWPLVLMAAGLAFLPAVLQILEPRSPAIHGLLKWSHLPHQPWVAVDSSGVTVQSAGLELFTPWTGIGSLSGPKSLGGDRDLLAPDGSPIVRVPSALIFPKDSSTGQPTSLAQVIVAARPDLFRGHPKRAGGLPPEFRPHSPG